MMHRLIAVALAATVAVAVPTHAELVEGKDFEFVPEPSPLPEPGEQVRVTEYFNYSCPACNAWFPRIELWLEESELEYLVWERTPLAFQRYGGLFARTHYVFEAFGRTDLAGAFFAAIHKERKILNSAGRIAEWLAEEHGIDEDKAEDSFKSFGVRTKMKRAARRTELYGVNSTPSFVVADRYLVPPSYKDTPEQTFEVIAELVTAIHEGKAPS